MKSKQRTKGYLLIDNGEGAPPDYDAQARAMGKYVIAAPGKRKEWDTITCRHCQQVFLYNSMRRRSREWCWNCDHYICDRCAQVRGLVGCMTYAAILDRDDAIIRKTERAGA